MLIGGRKHECVLYIFLGYVLYIARILFLLIRMSKKNDEKVHFSEERKPFHEYRQRLMAFQHADK